jgi:hypothetical protein
MSETRLGHQLDQMAWSARQNPSVAIPKRFPLVNRMQARSPNLNPEKDARLINCYAELDPEDRAYWIYKRFGISGTPAYSGPSNSYGRGINVVPVGLTSVANASQLIWVAQETDGNPHVFVENSDIGAMTSNNLYGLVDIIPTVNAGRVVAVINPNSGAYAVASNPLVLYELQNISGVLSLLTTVTPTGPVSVAYLDGYVFYIDVNGNIYNSDAGNPVSFTATSVIKASASSSRGIAIASHLSYIVAFTDITGQVFYDEGNATGSVLGPVPDAQLPVGCFFKDSLASIDNELFWLTYNATGTVQVGRLTNLSYRTCSTPAIEKYLTRLKLPLGNGTDWIYGWTLKLAGHRFYGFTSISGNFTFVYDIDQQLWYQWTDVNGNYWPITAIWAQDLGSDNLDTGQYVQRRDAGQVYDISDQYVFNTDYGNVIPVDIYTPNFDGGTTRRKYLRTLYIDGDKVPAKLKVRHSDDDYNTWSNFREVDLNRKKPRIIQAGSFDRRRAYHFRHQAPTTFRIRDCDMQLDIGTL